MPQFPDLTQFWMLIYGGYGYDPTCEWQTFLGLATGVAMPGNPPFAVNDFLNMYAKFAGAPTALNAVLAVNSSTVYVGAPAGNALAAGQLIACQGLNSGNVITEVNTSDIEFIGSWSANNPTITVSSTTGLIVGQPLSGENIPTGAFIAAIGSGQITVDPAHVPTAAGVSIELTAITTALTVSAAAVSSQPNALAQIYTAPMVPLFVIQTYLNLANASLMQSRWRESWQLAMCLYIAHFCTLFLQTDGNTQTTANQAVVNGLQSGITVSKSADGLAKGMQPVPGLANWGAWTLTQYGVQLATMARVVGAGAIYIR